MPESLTDYILKSLAAGQKRPQIEQLLAGLGWSAEAIEQGFRETGLPMPPSQPLPVIKKAEQKPVRPQEPAVPWGQALSLTNVLSLLGVMLILAAGLIIIVSQWGASGPLGRVLFLAVPMALLWCISAALSSKPGYAQLHLFTLAGGCLMFPFVVGAALVQFGLVPSLSAPLVAWSLGASLPVYLGLEFIGGRQEFSTLSLIALYGLLLSLGIGAGWWGESFTLVFLTVAVPVGAAGFWLGTAKKRTDGPVIALCSGMVLLVEQLYVSGLVAFSSPPTTAQCLLLFLVNLVGLGLVFACRRLAKLGVRLEAASFYHLCFLVENLAAPSLLGPFLLLGLDNLGYGVVGLTMSFLFLAASAFLPLPFWLICGAVGIFVSTLSISSRLFINTMGLPLTILLAGFGLIGLAYLVQRLNGWRKQAHLYDEWLAYPEEEMDGDVLLAGPSFYHMFFVPAFLFFLYLLTSSFSSYHPVSEPPRQSYPVYPTATPVSTPDLTQVIYLSRQQSAVVKAGQTVKVVYAPAEGMSGTNLTYLSADQTPGYVTVRYTATTAYHEFVIYYPGQYHLRYRVTKLSTCPSVQPYATTAPLPCPAAPAQVTLYDLLVTVQ